jgi:hypothetical protein
MNRDLLLSLVIVFFAQSFTYFQLQGQFIWKYFRENPYVIALAGYPISLLLIYFTRYSASAFGGETWPGRLIGFAVGATVFTVLSYLCLKEPMTTKTLVCLGLSIAILYIQIFWK